MIFMRMLGMAGTRPGDMSRLWEDSWFESAAFAARDIWRGVEAQHVVATMRLVDSVQEQELLEELLDGSKPPIPDGATALHYLLFTPFRYRSPKPSRFRRSDEPGAFYGADEPATVAAELAYWRWQFLMESEEFHNRELESVHTFFLAHFEGRELAIGQEPWTERRDLWRDARDYSACHALAAEARQKVPAIASIRYESARREGGQCNVVFQPQALSIPQLHVQQTWTCKTTATKVIWAHDRDLLEFPQAT